MTTTTSTEPTPATTTTRVEWGAKLTWPDGHTEINDQGDRSAAEAIMRTHNDFYPERGVRATLVSRTIATTDWTPVPPFGWDRITAGAESLVDLGQLDVES